MNIFDSLNEMKEKVNFFEEEKNVLKNQTKERIKEIEDLSKEKLDSCDNNINYIKRMKRPYEKKISQASWFDVDEIGEVLAKLVSVVENEPYSYYVANYHGICKYYEDGYGYDTVSLNYKVYLINKESKVINQYNEEYINEIGSTVFKNDDEIIVLAQRYLNDHKISFYDGMANESHLIDIKNYNYIYDFINYLISYKIDNNLFDLNKEELENLLTEFLNEYLKGTAKVKKGKRK